MPAPANGGSYTRVPAKPQITAKRGRFRVFNRGDFAPSGPLLVKKPLITRKPHGTHI